MSDIHLETIGSHVIEGDAPGATAAVQAALDAGLSAESVLKGSLIPAMDEVGRLFESGELFVPEMLVAARAMQSGLGLLKLLLVDSNVEAAGRVVIGTVQGDLHDIGKNLVAMMMEGAGFEIIDLGVDVQPEDFVAAARDHEADVVAMSALLTTTMSNMEATVKALQEAGLKDRVKVMVGGAPLTQDFAEQIGADGFASDASQAAKVAKTLVGA
jgi:5-methyltetrahydrofolate--homocysteine methyltransferase